MAQGQQMEKKIFAVKGMHCASCVRTIERSLQRMPGVTEAVVNLATEKASVTFDPAQTTGEYLAQAVATVGYEAVIEAESSPDHEQGEQAKTFKMLWVKVVVNATPSKNRPGMQ